jgi:hypothetical protein
LSFYREVQAGEDMRQLLQEQINLLTKVFFFREVQAGEDMRQLLQEQTD